MQDAPGSLSAKAGIEEDEPGHEPTFEVRLNPSISRTEPAAESRAHCRKHARFGLMLSAAFLMLMAAAGAQNFTVTMDPFPYPAAINPGGVDATTVAVDGIGSFSGTVNLSCQITPPQTGGATPTCTLSRQSVTVPGNSSVSISAQDVTPSPGPGLYKVTVTGTASGTTDTQSASTDFTIVAVTPQFTITVVKPMSPTSIAAGNGNASQGEITITPLYGYVSPTGPDGATGVTLSCSSISPLVTIPPVCSFSPANPTVAGAPVTATIFITPYGPEPITARQRSSRVYALWFGLPMLGVLGAGALGGKKARTVCGLMTLAFLSAALMLVPACNNTNPNGNNNTVTDNGVTPANTYTFTIQGVDADGASASNSGTGSSNPTVTLRVTAPTSN
jgi:hypothetical protein